MENNPIQSKDKIENQSISAQEQIQQSNSHLQNEGQNVNISQIRPQSQRRQEQIQKSQQNVNIESNKIDPMPISQNEKNNHNLSVNADQNDVGADPSDSSLGLNIQSLTQNKDELLETLYQPEACNPDNNPALLSENIEASFQNRQHQKYQIEENHLSDQNIQTFIDNHYNQIQQEKTQEHSEDYFEQQHLNQEEFQEEYQPSLTEVSHKLQQEQSIQQWRDEQVHINSQSLSGGFQFKSNTDYEFVGFEENSSKTKGGLKDSEAKVPEQSNFKIKPAASVTKSAGEKIETLTKKNDSPGQIIANKVEPKQKEKSLQSEIESAFTIKKKQQPKKQTKSLKDELRKFQLHEQQRKKKEKQTKAASQLKIVPLSQIKSEDPKKQQPKKAQAVNKKQQLKPVAETKKKQQLKSAVETKKKQQSKSVVEAKEKQQSKSAVEVKKKQQPKSVETKKKQQSKPVLETKKKQQPKEQIQQKKKQELKKKQQLKQAQKKEIQTYIIPKNQEKKIQKQSKIQRKYPSDDDSEQKPRNSKNQITDEHKQQKEIPKANNRLTLTTREKPQNILQEQEIVEQDKKLEQPQKEQPIVVKPLKKKKKKTNKPKVENIQLKQSQKVNLEQTRATEEQSHINIDPHHRYSEAPNKGKSDQNNPDDNNDKPLRYSLQVQPDERNATSGIVQSTSQLRGSLMTSLIIVKEAEKERVGTTYKMFLKYSFQYQKTVQTYKSILRNVSNELQKQKVLKRFLQDNIQDYFQDFCKINKQFNEKCYKFQIESQLISPSTNRFANIRLQLKKGFDQMIYLRKSIANQYNRVASYINNTVLQNIKKAFEHYYFSIGQEEIKQNARKQQHYRREQIFKKVQSKLDKHFNKGLQGKLKDDLFIQITKYINEQKYHRTALRTFGRGILDIRRTFIKCEKELFDKLQDILNKLKFESKMIYSFEPKVFNDIVDVTMEIKSKTKFGELCTLTDLDYIKYVLEVHTKRENNDFTSRHFEDYLNLDFFDRVVGNIRDMLKGATNKIFPMRNEREQLIHSISGNLILFDRQNDDCKDKYCIKNINAKIISEGFVEFDQLLKGIIFDDSRTIRLRMVDSDRAQELICYLNQKEDDFEV